MLRGVLLGTRHASVADRMPAGLCSSKPPCGVQSSQGPCMFHSAKWGRSWIKPLPGDAVGCAWAIHGLG